MYYAGKGKFWYVYFQIRSKRLKWFAGNKCKPLYLNNFIDLYIKYFRNAKSEKNYCLLHIKNRHDSYYDLINIKLRKKNYTIQRQSFSMTKYRAYALSYYAYYRYRDVFLPVRKDFIIKNKYNFNKIRKRYKYFNTNYNKFDILAYLITQFYIHYIERSFDNNFISSIFDKMLKLTKERKILVLYTNYLKAISYIRIQIVNKKVTKGEYSIYLMNKRNIDRDYKEIINQYNKCYKCNKIVKFV